MPMGKTDSDDSFIISHIHAITYKTDTCKLG